MQEFSQPSDLDSETITTELRQQYLLKRISVGVLLVVGLLGVWVLFDALAPASPGVPATHSVTPVHQSGGTIQDKSAAVPPVAAPAAVAIIPQAVPSIDPSVAASPLPAVVVPSVQQNVIAQPPSVLPVVSPPTASPALASPVFVSRPLKGRFSGKGQFGVQMGAFTIAGNAEKLRAKMQSQDIPVIIEKRSDVTRVHAGPFASRAAAESARVKLQALGMGTGMLVIFRK